MPMSNNLRLYHTVLKQLCQWLPNERITRLRNLALLASGLYLSGAVQLPLVVRKWPQRGKVPSLVNRLSRFLSNERFSVQNCYRPIAQQLVGIFAGQTIRLIIDCTKVGFNHQIMVVAIAYRKRALPLAWSVHPWVKGHVAVKDQIALLNHVQSLLPPESEVCLVGDSGFKYVSLLRWLRAKGWHFVIRQSGNNMVSWSGQPWVKLIDLGLTEGKTQVIGWVRLTRKNDYGWVWLILHWKQGEDEPWYLVSDSDRPGYRKLIRSYEKRMWIEEMFGDMKGHGFNLEATHLRRSDRIMRLFLGVCLVYVWFISLGSWVVKNGLRHLVDRKNRRDKSYFRIGWDWLERCCRLNQLFALRLTPYL
jgi:hypothetical protein